MPWYMTWKEFFIAFWPNFLSSVVTGVIIGFAFSWWIARKIGSELNEREREYNYLDDKKNFISKKIAYYNILSTLIKGEVAETLFVRNQNPIEDLSNDPIISKYLSGEYQNFKIETWELLKDSGELPKYLDLSHITKFTDYFSLLVENSKLEDKISSITFSSLHQDKLIMRIRNRIKQCYTKIHNNLDLLDEMRPELVDLAEETLSRLEVNLIRLNYKQKKVKVKSSTIIKRRIETIHP